MESFLELAFMWSLMLIPSILPAGNALLFHATASKASPETVEKFIDKLHPFLQHGFGDYLRKEPRSTLIAGLITLLVNSLFFYIMIFILLLGMIQSLTLLEFLNNLFWLVLTLIVMIRIWFFGYQLRKMEASKKKKKG